MLITPRTRCSSGRPGGSAHGVTGAGQNSAAHRTFIAFRNIDNGAGSDQSGPFAGGRQQVERGGRRKEGEPRAVGLDHGRRNPRAIVIVGIRKAWFGIARPTRHPLATVPTRSNPPLRPMNWCPGRDSNPHASRRGILSPLRLPISPPGRYLGIPGPRRLPGLRSHAGSLPVAVRTTARQGRWAVGDSASRPRSDASQAVVKWRLSPESNRGGRLCRPLHDHSATQPKPGSIGGTRALVTSKAVHPDQRPSECVLATLAPAPARHCPARVDRNRAQGPRWVRDAA